MRRVALIVAAIAIAVVAYGKPRTPDLPLVVDGKRVASPLAPLTTTSADTIWFGGTRWDPVDARWEALRDGVWTFESGVGSAINTDPQVKPVGFHRLMEGWSGIQYTNVERYGVFRRLSEAHFAGSEAVCVGDATGVLGGDWSLWAGLTEQEADSAGWVAGQGFGDSWISIEREFAYGGGPVTLQYDYVCETPTSWVWVDTYIDTSAAQDYISVAYYEGIVSGHATINLVPGVNLPSAPGSIRVRFELVAFGGSDENGGFNSDCGAFAVDNIALSGGVTYGPQDFETSDDGWATHPQPYSNGSGGDWTDLESIADLPLELGSEGCSLGDSVLVAWTPGGGYWEHGCCQSNLALSPWIDIDEAGLEPQGFVLEVGGFYRATGQGALEVTPRIQWFPFDPAHPELGPSDFANQWDLNRRLNQFPACGAPGSRFQIDLTGRVPSYAQAVRIGLGVYNGCCFILCDCFGADFNSTPWFDDIRFGVYGAPTSDVPEVPEPPSSQLLVAQPNPLRLTTRISFTTPAEGHATLTFYDIAGRHVRTLVDAPLPAGSHEVTWDARDEAGRRVASGLYLYRLTAGEYTAAQKLVVAP